MMNAGTVFTTVSLMMLANGVVLAVVSRDLPATLRPAAVYWQFGTMLIAAGCAVLAFGAPLARPIMLFAANGLIVFGLTAYYAAVQRFGGARPKAWQFLPAVVATACVLWFSTVDPNFQIRVIVVSIVWIWLMLASVLALLDRSREDTALSRSILIGIFTLVMVYAGARLFIYLTMDLGPDFAIESGTNWLNMLSPIVMTLLPVVGTTAFLLMCSDSLKRQLETAASTDYLTGLPNRRALAQYGAKRFREAARSGTALAVAILDIDHFKAFNDTYGHGLGDDILRVVARTLQGNVRSSDLAGRWGGEEFLVLLPETQLDGALAVANKIRESVAMTEFKVNRPGIQLTISLGVCEYKPDQNIFEAISRADQALFQAKLGGRNRAIVAA